MEMKAVLERWSEYIEELFYDERVEQLDVHNSREGPAIVKAEVEVTLKKMKKVKAIGDDIIAVMLTDLEDFGVDCITDIAPLINEGEKPVSKMCKSTFVTIPKYLELVCNEYRTISTILQRIRNKILPAIGKKQFCQT